MKVFATFITATPLFLYVAVHSQVDQCDYRIDPDPNNAGLIGVYFPQVNLPENETLLVSYRWKRHVLTDEYSYVNAIMFLNRTQSIARCFDDKVSTSNASIFWSEYGSITITYNNGECTTLTTVYAATYFTERCGSTIQLSELNKTGLFSFPSNWKTFPCNINCTWIIKSNISGSSIAIWIKGFIGFGNLTIASKDPMFRRNTCWVTGQDGLSNLYVSDFGVRVSINLDSSQGLGERFTVEYKLINQSAYRDTDCSVGNATVDSRSCMCNKSLLRLESENGIYEKQRSSYLFNNKVEQIMNVTATAIPQQITCRKCDQNVSTTTTTTTSETSTHSPVTTTSIYTITPFATSALVQSSTAPGETTLTPMTTTDNFTVTMSPTEYISTLLTTDEGTLTTSKRASTELASTVTESTIATTPDVPQTVSDSSTMVDTTMATVNATFATTTTEISTASSIPNTVSNTLTSVFAETSTSLTESFSTREPSTSTSEQTAFTSTTFSSTIETVATVATTSELTTSSSNSNSVTLTKSTIVTTSFSATSTQTVTTSTDTPTTSSSKLPATTISESPISSSSKLLTTTASVTQTTSSSKLPSTPTTDTLVTSSTDQTRTTKTIPSDDLSNIKDGITPANVGVKMKQLTNALLNITTYLTPEDVSDAVAALSAAADIKDMRPEVGQDFDKAADITLRNGSESFTLETTNMLLDAVKSYAENVLLTVGQSSESYSGSSFVNVVTVVNCSDPLYQIGLIDLADTNSSSVARILSNDTSEVYSKEWSKVKGMVGYIAIKPSVICSNESQETKSGETEATRVSFQIYRTTNIFSTDATANTSSTRSSYCKQTYPGDVVISATVVKRLNNQTDPQMSVQIGFQRSLNTQNKSESRNYRTFCGFWQSGSWVDNSSVQLINQSMDTFIFQSDHLTDFTLLTSSSSKERIFCETNLDILGTVGSSCSFAGLTFMSISLLIIRWARLSTSPIVLISLFFNFSFALFFICFILFADQFTLNISDFACIAFAAVMYYLLMSTMMWTCCRAALVYKRYVIVFDTGGYSKIFTFNKVSTFLSTSTPLIVVLTVAFTDNNFFERQDNFCWINPTYAVYAVVIPIGVMLIMSIIVLIMVVRSVFFSFHQETSVYRSKKNDRKSFRRKIWVLFVIQISLGLPWIFLYLTEIPGTSVFHYLFTITNGFQGVWIAALHFYERRKDLSKLLRQAKLRRSAHHSIVTQTSSIDSSKSQ